MKRLLAAAAMAAVFVLPARAQMPRSGLGSPIPGLAPSAATMGGRMSLTAPPTFPSDRRFFDDRRHHFFPGFSPGFIPLWFGDYAAQPAYVPVPVYETPPAVPSAKSDTAPERAPVEPLIIERQGDGFVRYGGTIATAAPGGRQPSLPLSDYRASTTEPKPTPAQPSIILVFRDNHRLEISDYMIVDSVLYARGLIPVAPIRLADLDLPATVRVNQLRGVEFRVPLSSNEVVVRF